MTAVPPTWQASRCPCGKPAQMVSPAGVPSPSPVAVAVPVAVPSAYRQRQWRWLSRGTSSCCRVLGAGSGTEGTAGSLQGHRACPTVTHMSPSLSWSLWGHCGVPWPVLVTTVSPSLSHSYRSVLKLILVIEVSPSSSWSLWGHPSVPKPVLVTQVSPASSWSLRCPQACPTITQVSPIGPVLVTAGSPVVSPTSSWSPQCPQACR